jgi:hypothetical protein
VRLPNWDRAIIAPEKLRDYLLKEMNPQNDGKARLFAALGYSQDNWDVLAHDLQEQHLTRDGVPGRLTPFGQRYTITASLRGPAGQAIIMSVWQIDIGTEVPRFISAYRP